MALKLNADDLERIRGDLAYAAEILRTCVRSKDDDWVARYSRDVRQLRAAYTRERRIRMELEEKILTVIGLAEYERDETAEERLTRIGRWARQLVGLEPGAVLRLAPRTVRS